MTSPAGEGFAASEWVRRVFNALYFPSVPVSLAAFVGLDIWGPRPWWHAALLHGAAWAIVLALLMALLRVRAKLVHPDPAIDPPPDLSRRRLMFDASLGLAGVGTGGVMLVATCVTPWDFKVARYTVSIPRLPRALEGLRLVQLSDTHLGPRIPADYIRRVVDHAIALKPDLFVLSGDYVHNGAGPNELAVALFEPLTRAAPVIGVLGNHDWYGDGPDMARRLKAIGVRLVDNDRVFLTSDKRVADVDDGSSLCIAGFGDLKTATVEPESALGHVDETTPRIVISHNPDTAELPEVVRGPRVDLMISGHYHGGQVKFPIIGTLPFIQSRHGTKYFGGRVDGPAFPVIVSRGIGMSIMPVRLGVPPELVEITLTRAQA
jgi:predicted MPP superfamily phosphohydrolase